MTTNGLVKTNDITIPDHHRAIKPNHLKRLMDKMAQDGFNTSYPITIDSGNNLVDGRHRLEAAIANGIDSIPYVYKPEGISIIRHSLRCNADGQDCQADDVFDLAELCWKLSKEGMTGGQIAEELGKRWSNDLVSKHKLIKDRLHPLAWNLARYSSTKKYELVEDDKSDLVESDSTIVDWRETHFRSLLSHLALTGNDDRPVMRGQLAAIWQILDRFARPNKKVTAHWIGEIAERLAWHIELARYMRSNLVKDVPLHDWKYLLKSIRSNVFGTSYSKDDQERFISAVNAINERIAGIKLYHDDALKRIPLLGDNSIDLVATDPPYNITAYNWDQIGPVEEYLDWLRQWLMILRPKLKKNYHLFFFCDPDYQARIETLLIEDDWPLKSRIIWEYRNLSMGRDVKDRFINNYQILFHCGTHDLNWPPDWNDERFAVQRYASPQSNFNDDNKKRHPTQKPIGLIEQIIKLGSKPGDTILDCFAGAGTTGKACMNISQRRCILIEQEAEFCQVIESWLKVQRTTKVV